MFATGNGRSTCCKSNEWQHEQHEDPVGDGEDYRVNDYQPEEAADQIESVEVQEEKWCLTTDECCECFPSGMPTMSMSEPLGFSCRLHVCDIAGWGVRFAV